MSDRTVCKHYYNPYTCKYCEHDARFSRETVLQSQLAAANERIAAFGECIPIAMYDSVVGQNKVLSDRLAEWAQEAYRDLQNVNYKMHENDSLGRHAINIKWRKRANGEG